MVIITGLGRCGTSILTKYLQEVGIGLGKNVSWHKEARAGLELSPAYSITDWMYDQFIKKGNPINIHDPIPGDYWQGSYAEAMYNVDKDERQGKVEVFKDPRITWHRDLIRAWYLARRDIKLIICHRKPEDVYASRKALPPKYDDPKRRELIEYKIDFEEFFTTVLEIGIPYRTLYFPNFLFNYTEVFKVLEDVGLSHDSREGKKVWDRIIDLTKYK
jgi:hypothetical protein